MSQSAEQDRRLPARRARRGPVSEDIPGLDRASVALVLAAIAWANGSHEDSGVEHNEDGTPRRFTRLASLYPWPDPEAQS